MNNKLLTLAGLMVAALVCGTNQTRAGVYGPVPTIDYNYPHYANSPTLTKFVDKLPGLTPAGANALGQYIPLAAADTTTYATTASDYYEIALVEYREKMHTGLPGEANALNKTLSTTGTRLRGYVQLSTAVVPGSQLPLYYPDGTPIMINGVQAKAVDNPHYLGPLILATKNRPVRVKFYNLLPVGAKGNLFLPVDTSVAGAGSYEIDHPTTPGATIRGDFTQNRATLHLHGGLPGWESDGTVHQWITPANDPLAANYPVGQSVEPVPDMDNGILQAGCQTFFWPNQQSGRLLFYHDHAWGMTAANVYAGEAAGYLVVDPAGEEDRLAALGVPGTIGTAGADLAHLVPLVIQDKTWVWGNNATTVNLDGTVTVGASTGTWAVDPMWAKHVPDSKPGDLWTPHIYVPIQDPFALDGLNPLGRWHYGPWFWPIFPALAPLPENSHVPESFQDTAVVNGTAFPYLDVQPAKYRLRILNACSDRFVNLQLYQANKGIVSGFAIKKGGRDYVAPVVTITPAGNDNTGRGAVATAVADTNPTSPTFGQIISVTVDITGSDYTVPPIVTIQDAIGKGTGANVTAVLYTAPTEVGMVPFVNPVSSWPAGYGTPDNRPEGVPDPRKRGPALMYIGTEGGILPNAVVKENVPINYDWNRGSATWGNVLEHTCYLGPAERADVIVDFSQYAGQTLILYNDAPAPTPAGAPYYDYFTCSPDNRDSGGAVSTLPGKGPNTRTMMQIRVAGTPSATPPPVNAYDAALLAKLQAPAVRDTAGNITGGGVPAIFATVQDAPVVPQPPYEPAYGPTPGTSQNWYSRVDNNALTFTPYGAPADITMQLVPKAIAEEMDMIYARMNATLGVELPFTGAQIQTTVWYGLIDPPTEFFNKDDVQIWKLTHNGVDTHAIHFHIVNVQIINRVGWDNAVKPPDPEELGWKDTIKMNPLEDIIFATRAKVPILPFKLPNSKRHHNPEQPTGSVVGFRNLDPLTGDVLPVVNQEADFGWEYVWHCHLLGHEEYDMMRPFVVVMAPEPASNLVLDNKTVPGSVVLNWTDNSPQPEPLVPVLNVRPPNTNPEDGFIIERAPVTGGVGGTVGTFVKIGEVGMDVTTFTDSFTTPNPGSADAWAYRVIAFNAGLADPSIVAQAPPSGRVPPNPAITVTATPSLLGVVPLKVDVTWTHDGANLSGFIIERATVVGLVPGPFVQLAQVGPSPFAWGDTTVLPFTLYQYRVTAVNGPLSSAPTLSAIVETTDAPPAAPTAVIAVPSAPGVAPLTVSLAWADNSFNETGFIIQKAIVVNGVVGAFADAGAVAADVRSWTDNTDVSPNTTYVYRVAAEGGAGNSAFATSAPVTTESNQPPADPSGLTVTSTTRTTINLQWNDNSNNELNFELQRGPTAAGPWTLLAPIAANQRTFQDTGLTRRTTYYYQVRAVNGFGASLWVPDPALPGTTRN